MKANNQLQHQPNGHKAYLYVVIGTLLVLSIPLVSMQFSEDVNWDLFDFLIIGVLLLIIGFSYVFISNKIKSQRNRLILGAGLFLLLATIWVELAVGIFD